MATTEVQLSERYPILTSTDETSPSNPVASPATPVETNTTITRK